MLSEEFHFLQPHNYTSMCQSHKDHVLAVTIKFPITSALVELVIGNLMVIALQETKKQPASFQFSPIKLL